MSHTTQVPAAARRALIIAGTLLATATSAEAQGVTGSGHRWEIGTPSGWLVPTGDHRTALKRGGLNAVQASFVAHPAVAVTATVGWARSRDLATADEPKLDVFTYDLGAEFRTPRLPAGRLTVGAFAGLGAGARSYNHRSLDVDATHNVAAYASVGSEIGMGRVRLRLEARDYVAGFKPLMGEDASATRNDVALLAGLRLVRR